MTDLHAVDSAFVPLIKLKYSGIEIDILFARLALKQVPENQELADDNLLRNLDPQSIRSLNGKSANVVLLISDCFALILGCRVADEILRLIPNRQNFIVTLRAVKIWAKRTRFFLMQIVSRRIFRPWHLLKFSRLFRRHHMGDSRRANLPTLSIRYARRSSPQILFALCNMVCARFKSAYSLICLLVTFREWPHPVLLHDNESSSRSDIPALREMVWDSRNRVSDRYHLMPIITPAYPEQNSTFNVTHSTKQVISSALKEALTLTMEITAGKAQWSTLFEEVNFFSRYRHFLSLQCITENEKDHLSFSGLVESKIRILVGSRKCGETRKSLFCILKITRPRIFF